MYLVRFFRFSKCLVWETNALSRNGFVAGLQLRLLCFFSLGTWNSGRSDVRVIQQYGSEGLPIVLLLLLLLRRRLPLPFYFWSRFGFSDDRIISTATVTASAGMGFASHCMPWYE